MIKNGTKDCNGFTFLEVLLAVTILSVVITLVYANFGAGIRSYKKGYKRSEIMQEVRGGLRLLERDIEQMLPVSGGMKDVSFLEKTISFITVGGSEKTTLKQITYTIDEGSISKVSMPYTGTGSEPTMEGKDVASFIVLRGVEEGKFEFFNGESWIKEIKPGKKSPLAIRVNLLLKKGAEEKRYRTVFRLPQVKIDEKKSGGEDQQNINGGTSLIGG